MLFSSGMCLRRPRKLKRKANLGPVINLMSTQPKKPTAKESPDYSVRLIFTHRRALRFKAVRVMRLQVSQDLLARDLGVDRTVITRLENTKKDETTTPEFTWGMLKKVLGSSLARYVQTGKGFDGLEILVNSWLVPTKVYDAGGTPSALKLRRQNLPEVFQAPEMEEEDDETPEN